VTVVRFQVRLEDEAQADAVASELEQRLGVLAAVEEVQAEPAEPQVIGEIAIVVAGAVALTRGGRDIVAGVRETIDELTRLVESWRRLKRTVFVEVDGAQKDVRELGDEDLERLAA
jgi:hypothetical protein